MKKLLPNTALLVIDMQKGFDDPVWGPRNNPDAEANVAGLLAAWRVAKAPIIHVHHDSPHADGRMRPGTPGNEVKRQARPLAHEKVFRKTVNSAFIGTGLEAELWALNAPSVVVVGLTTNHCISTTARVAGNLGFETFVAADATASFDRADLTGQIRPAEDVHNAALADLQDEFAEIVESRWLFDALKAAMRADHGANHV